MCSKDREISFVLKVFQKSMSVTFDPRRNQKQDSRIRLRTYMLCDTRDIPAEKKDYKKWYQLQMLIAKKGHLDNRTSWHNAQKIWRVLFSSLFQQTALPVPKKKYELNDVEWCTVPSKKTIGPLWLNFRFHVGKLSSYFSVEQHFFSGEVCRRRMSTNANCRPGGLHWSYQPCSHFRPSCHRTCGTTTLTCLLEVRSVTA